MGRGGLQNHKSAIIKSGRTCWQARPHIIHSHEKIKDSLFFSCFVFDLAMTPTGQERVNFILVN